MTRTVTLAELRTRALAAADMPQLMQSGWCPASEVNLLINGSGSELHDTLVMTFADYFVHTATYALAPGKEIYPLPPDFFKVRGVYCLSPDGQRCQLLPYTETERGDLYSQSGTPCPTRYRPEDGNLVVLPVPGSGTIEFRYVYQYPWLSADTDALSYNIVAGWDDLIVYDVASKLRVKGQKDAGTLMAMVDRLRSRIGRAADERQADGVGKVRDSASRRSLRGRCLP